MNNNGSKYLFSFVMPIYNTEKYLSEAVESILDQELQFEDNCEIVFVNDGSTDKSEKICLAYQKKFPGNIKYIKQENKGVSAARNVGVAAAEGRYLSFLDSDDMISSNTLHHVLRFFEDNYNEIDLVTIPMMYFEAQTGHHPLNEKFMSHDRIVDLTQEEKSFQSAIGPAFVKTSAIRGRYKFDEDLQIFEDGKLLNTLLVEKHRYGLVSKPTYYYRMRSDYSSAVERRWRNSAYYDQIPKRAFTELFEVSKSKLGYIPRYIQHFVMYHMRLSLKKNLTNYLTGEQIDDYKQVFIGLLKDIDDEVIMDQKNVKYTLLLHAVSLKHGRSIQESVVVHDDGHAYWGDLRVYNASNVRVDIERIEAKGGVVVISGRVGAYNVPGFSLVADVNGQLIAAGLSPRLSTGKKSFNEYAYYENDFYINLDLNGSATTKMIDFKLKCGESIHEVKYLKLKKTIAIDRRYLNSYKVVGDHIAALKDKTLVLSSNSSIHRSWRYVKLKIEIHKSKLARH